MTRNTYINNNNIIKSRICKKFLVIIHVTVQKCFVNDLSKKSQVEDENGEGEVKKENEKEKEKKKPKMSLVHT